MLELLMILRGVEMAELRVPRNLWHPDINCQRNTCIASVLIKSTGLQSTFQFSLRTSEMLRYVFVSSNWMSYFEFKIEIVRFTIFLVILSAAVGHNNEFDKFSPEYEEYAIVSVDNKEYEFAYERPFFYTSVPPLQWIYWSLQFKHFFIL